MSLMSHNQRRDVSQKEGPKHKEFPGSGGLGEGSGREGFCPNSSCLCFFWFLTTAPMVDRLFRCLIVLSANVREAVTEDKGPDQL